jgi:hypothetical protein
MFNQYRTIQYERYLTAKEYFVENTDILWALEKYFADETMRVLNENKLTIKKEYNEASYLYPFWQNYPPDERGRQPKGDQFPWIEVGEHVVGSKLPRLFSEKYKIFDYGLPTGSDERFVVKHEEIARITKNKTDICWLFIDIKSVGPRDNFDHIVMSHNQVSGNGLWKNIDAGIVNDTIIAKGKIAKHKFHCTLPPLYVLSEGMIAPVVTVAVKPIYKMLKLQENGEYSTGQPLDKIAVITIPNGLLLTGKKGYIKKYPGLFFPGKDDKEKNPLKVRARISFELLSKIDPWRVQFLSI